MERLDLLVDEEGRRQIMTGGACQYHISDLRDVRETYAQTKDLALTH